MAYAGLSGNRRDDETRRARSLDTRLLRRMGDTLYVLGRKRPQLHRPVLRNVWGPGRRYERAKRGSPVTAGLVQAEPSFGPRQMVDSQQHQYAAVGDPVCDEFRRQQQGSLPE